MLYDLAMGAKVIKKLAFGVSHSRNLLMDVWREVLSLHFVEGVSARNLLVVFVNALRLSILRENLPIPLGLLPVQVGGLGLIWLHCELNDGYIL